MNAAAAVIETEIESDRAAARTKAFAKQWARIAPGVVYLDPRVGSAELLSYFRKLGVRSAIYDGNLIAGDVVFKCGHQEPSAFCDEPHGCHLAIERKTLTDLVGSLLKNRMAKQVPDLIEGCTQAWVVVEGIWRPGGDDCIETFRGGTWQPARVSLTYSQLSSWLVRYDVFGRGRLHRWRTANMTETAAFSASLFRWWQKEWKKHNAEAVEKMPAPIKALMFRATNMQRTAASLPEIGLKNMKKVSRYFGSILEMVNASEDDWRRAGLGKKDAATVWTTIRRKYR